MKYCIFFIVIIVLLTPVLYSEDEFDFDEDELFPDEEIIIESEDVVDDSVTEEMEKESVNITGDISGHLSYSISQDAISGDESFDANPYSTQIDAHLLLDVRLLKGIKALANLGIGYYPLGVNIPKTLPNPNPPLDTITFPESTDTVISLKEFFIDVNIARKVYFRLGKQVLKWGTGYLWNPTDFINIEKKSFLFMDSYREGVYGLKMHVPFGTLANLYGFINATDAAELADLAYALKIEALLMGTEASLSVWAREQYIPVFGFDFTSRIFDIDLRGELSISYGDNQHVLTPEGGDIKITDEWSPRFCLGFSTFFDLLEVEDRISLNGEFFYNHNGYEENMFDTDTIVAGTFLYNYYIPNYYGKYYGAVFLSINKFIVSDLTLSLNGLSNFSDLSILITTGLTWNPVTNFTTGFNIYTALGEENTEYTLSGNTIVFDLFLSLTF